MHPHLEALAHALREEHRFSSETLAKGLQGTLDQRIAAGVSWPPMKVEELSWSRRGPRLLLRASTSLHEGIQAGASITLSPPARAQGLEGSLLEVDGQWASVQLRKEDLPTWVEKGRVVVSERNDPASLRLLLRALEKADAHQSALQQVLLGKREPSFTDLPSAPPGLNIAQEKAAQRAMAAQELALIHGPPGTGKTHTLAILAKSLVAQGERPLALADSNAATDHLALAAESQGLKVLRLGHPARIRPEAKHLSLEIALSKGPFAKALQLMDKELKVLAQRGHWRERRALMRERWALEDQARAQAMHAAQIIVSTLGTLMRRLDQLPPTRTALIDEATQAMEPSIWAIVPAVERLILAGDPHQLGPVVTQPGNALERSLVDRLLAMGLSMPMLQVQHRMAPQISAMVQSVYGPEYKPSAQAARRRASDLSEHLPEWAQAGVLFLDTAGSGLEEEVDPASQSTRNLGEVKALAMIWSALLEAGLRSDQVVLLAPYRAQVDALKAHPTLKTLRAATMNAWQGREEEVVLCSLVRSNPEGRLGFVADERRLTVALTRAKRLLVLVGDSATLTHHPRFGSLLDQLDRESCIASIWGEPWIQLL
ncbi:MAG: ATP-dependent RNA/DNA helicase IGHMBP2 [Cognaticolwellia sp.]|jgi:ATP-dependent RNA/DNA helicase IGHMBP2